MTPEQISAICNAVYFLHDAAGEGLEINGMDSENLCGEVGEAFGCPDFADAYELTQSIRAILEAQNDRPEI